MFTDENPYSKIANAKCLLKSLLNNQMKLLVNVQTVHKIYSVRYPTHSV